MRKILLLLLTVALAGMGHAQDAPAGLEITTIWARPTVAAGETDLDASAPTSAVYMAITNNGDEDVRLVGASTGVAGVVEIHESRMTDEGVMQMRPVGNEGITLVAGEATELQPGGYHVMLMDLQTTLPPETAFTLTLTIAPNDPLADAYQVTVGVPVLELPPMAGDLRVRGAWARPTVAEDAAEDEIGAPTSAAYMQIENTSDEDVTLVSGAADAAGVVEIHESSMTDEGVMQMRPLMDGLTIPAGETAELRPGGFHVMLMDLQQPLVPGEALYLALTFDNEQTLALGVPIEDRLMGDMDMDME